MTVKCCTVIQTKSDVHNNEYPQKRAIDAVSLKKHNQLCPGNGLRSFEKSPAVDARLHSREISALRLTFSRETYGGCKEKQNKRTYDGYKM